MQKAYDPKAIEAQWATTWEQNDHFKASGTGTPYCVMLPPPNVTGSLHMGHGFQQTLMDALTRYHRMLGDNTLWQGGTDHAGIATQMVVERRLSRENISRHDLGRDGFLKKVWEWKEESGSTITRQVRRLGASIDWARERFTMDEGLSHATRESFIRLYNDGLIYRGKRLVNWDPKLNTAISDLEVENIEKNGKLWHIRYPLTKSYLVIATTRPETLLGDSAVAVHPDDERYQHLIGQTIKLPLTDREIPIIADDYVDQDFGTGCVKITPAHDFNDYEMGKRHNLPMRNILTADGHINDTAPEKYRGLERFKARKQIIADLEALGLLDKIEDHKNKVPMGKRSGVVIEPMLTDQWFVSMEGLAKPAIEAVETGALKFVPENWNKTYLQWLNNIQDWCISRQLWWGHRIPAWYDETGKVYVGHNETEVRTTHQLSDNTTLTQDEDVLDTWFTSALWPFATLGWPEKTPELSTFYPTSVLITGFDIIFFWVARMVMMGLKFLGKVPFKEVYITGLIRDAHGQKMSKSKGNVLDPVDLIDGIDLESLLAKRTANMMLAEQIEKAEKSTRKEFPTGIQAFGTDALRFTFCALASTGRDINFDMGRIEGYRNFCNKLWNATRFVLMRCENAPKSAENLQFGPFDTWIQAKLQHTINEVHRHFKQYRFDLLANTLYEFIWNEYCDWYVEMAKCNLTPATQYTLLTVLEQLLRLAHPIIPFITEALWHPVATKLGIDQPTLMTQAYPAEGLMPEHYDATWLKTVVTHVRTIRSEMNVSPAKTVQLILNSDDASDLAHIEACRHAIMALAKVSAIEVNTDTPENAASAAINHLNVFIPLDGLVDPAEEKIRLEKALTKLTAEKNRLEKKLGNASFVEKAPKAVVEKEHAKLAEIDIALKKLTATCKN